MKMTAPCQCPRCQTRRTILPALVKKLPAPRSTVKYRPEGLGFDIDWGGLLSNTVKAYGAVEQTRLALAVQQAQRTAALRAQEAELQMMQRRQTQMVAPAVSSGYVAAPGGQVMQLTPYGAMIPVPPPRRALPPWAIPAAVGVGALFLMRK